MGEVVPVAALPLVGDPHADAMIDAQRLNTTYAALGLDHLDARARLDEALRTVLEFEADEPYPVRIGQWSVTMPAERFRGILSSALVVAAIEASGAANTALVVLAALVPHLFDVTKVRVDADEQAVIADLHLDIAGDRRGTWAALPDDLRHEVPYLRFAELLDGLDEAGALRTRPGPPGLRQTLAEPAAGRAPAGPLPRVLLVGDEWFPRLGGLSTFNRLMARGLVEAGATVDVLLPRVNPEELADAEKSGVRLVSPGPIPGTTDEQTLMRAAAIEADEAPDVIVGHGRITGPAAAAQAASYPGAIRCHILHMAADEIEYLKRTPEHEVAKRAEIRADTEIELAGTAHFTFAVGPRLFERFDRDLGVLVPKPVLARIDPGFEFPAPAQRAVPSGVPQILMIGRWEDAYAKGLDIAARAIGHAVRLADRKASDVELLVRGVPDDEAIKLRAEIQQLSGLPSLSVIVRPYTADAEPLRRDLNRASLLLMPSRAEGFGLVGVEAITAGLPALITSESGLGRLLRDTLPAGEAGRFVVPVVQDDARDTEVWGHHIAAVLRDRAAAFANAFDLHKSLASEYTWPKSCAKFLDVVLRDGSAS